MVPPRRDEPVSERASDRQGGPGRRCRLFEVAPAGAVLYCASTRRCRFPSRLAASARGDAYHAAHPASVCERAVARARAASSCLAGLIAGGRSSELGRGTGARKAVAGRVRSGEAGGGKWNGCRGVRKKAGQGPGCRRAHGALVCGVSSRQVRSGERVKVACGIVARPEGRQEGARRHGEIRL